jgi:hypothetical protein
VDACSGLSASFIADNIADGSCCGFRACKGISGECSGLICLCLKCPRNPL